MRRNNYESEKIERLKKKLDYVMQRPMVKLYLAWIDYPPQEKAKCYREWDEFYEDPRNVEKPTSIDPYEMKYGWDIDVYKTLKEGIDRLTGGGEVNNLYEDAKEIFG